MGLIGTEDVVSVGLPAPYVDATPVPYVGGTDGNIAGVEFVRPPESVFLKTYYVILGSDAIIALYNNKSPNYIPGQETIVNEDILKITTDFSYYPILVDLRPVVEPVVNAVQPDPTAPPPTLIYDPSNIIDIRCGLASAYTPQSVDLDAWGKVFYDLDKWVIDLSSFTIRDNKHIITSMGNVGKVGQIQNGVITSATEYSEFPIGTPLSYSFSTSFVQEDGSISLATIDTNAPPIEVGMSDPKPQDWLGNKNLTPGQQVLLLSITVGASTQTIEAAIGGVY